MLPKMPIFDGSSDKWKGFMASFKFHAKRFRWDDRERLLRLRSCLTDKAAEFVERRPGYVRGNYRDLIRALQKRYGQKEEPSAVRRSLSCVQQLETESLEEYSDRVMTMTFDAFPHLEDRELDGLAVDYFMTGCRNRQAAMFASQPPPRTLGRAVKKVKTAVLNLKTFGVGKASRMVTFDGCTTSRTEMSPQSRRPPSPMRTPRFTTPPRESTIASHAEKGSEATPLLKQRTAADLTTLFGELLRRIASPSPSRGSPNRSPSRVICYQCRQPGHYKHDCPELGTEDEKNEQGLDKSPG